MALWFGGRRGAFSCTARHVRQGLEFLNDRLHLDVSTGPNLVCGDTSSDVPMVETAMALCPERTSAIFITKDKQLINRVTAVCPRTLILPSPDCLVTIMHECARLKDVKHPLTLRRRSSFSGNVSISISNEASTPYPTTPHTGDRAGCITPHRRRTTSSAAASFAGREPSALPSSRDVSPVSPKGRSVA